MKLEPFDFKSWRESMPKKMSKLRASREIGLDKNAYNRYEKEGMCPRYIRLAALKVKELERDAFIYKNLTG